MKLAIQIAQSDGSATLFPLTAKGVRVGASPECELQLAASGIPPHALSLITVDGRVMVYPAAARDVRLGKQRLGDQGAAWQVGDTLTIDPYQLQLIEDRGQPAPAEAPAARRRRPRAVESPAEVAPPASVKPRSDTAQYALLGAILLGAVGILFLPDPDATRAQAGNKVTFNAMLASWAKAKPADDDRQPPLEQIREQILAGYRSGQSSTASRQHYASALRMQMMRAIPQPMEATAPNAQALMNKYDAPVAFASESEYMTYKYLRDQLEASRSTSDE